MHARVLNILLRKLQGVFWRILFCLHFSKYKKHFSKLSTTCELKYSTSFIQKYFLQLLLGKLHFTYRKFFDWYFLYVDLLRIFIIFYTQICCKFNLSKDFYKTFYTPVFFFFQESVCDVCFIQHCYGCIVLI